MGKMKYIYQLVEEENFTELSSILGEVWARELIDEHKESYKIGGKYDSN
tara:strand:- start:16041 stop:16187 length:147 start_codon:yes stop_codon:yes gene_type:complete